MIYKIYELLNYMIMQCDNANNFLFIFVIKKKIYNKYEL